MSDEIQHFLNDTPAVAGSNVRRIEDTVAVISSSIPSAFPQDQLAAVEMIASTIKSEMKPKLDEAMQHHIAELVALLPELSEPQDKRLIPMVQIAAAALMTEPPNITLAKELIERVRGRMRRSPFGVLVRAGGSSSSRVILGLGTLLYFAFPLIYLFGRRYGMGVAQIFGIDKARIVLVALSGAIGSIVSIMVRIRDFAMATESDPTILFFTGFFKPVIGMAFALFVFVVLNSGILPIAVQDTKASYFFAAVAFVAGFSERFASDVANQQNVLFRHPRLLKPKVRRFNDS